MNNDDCENAREPLDHCHQLPRRRQKFRGSTRRSPRRNLAMLLRLPQTAKPSNAEGENRMYIADFAHLRRIFSNQGATPPPSAREQTQVTDSPCSNANARAWALE
jgi:hypothetical protein